MLTIDKTASPTLTDSDADGLYEATFTVTVSNIGTAAGTYDLSDTANLLPTGVTVSEVISVTAATDGANDPTANINAGFDGTATTTLLSASQTINASETHTYTIVIEYVVDTAAAGFDYAALACNGSPNNGFYNQATLTFNNKTVVATNSDSETAATFLLGGLLNPDYPELTGFNIPAGSERAMVVYAGFEREHELALLLGNYTGGGAPGGVIVTLSGPGGSVDQSTVFSWGVGDDGLLIPLFELSKELHTATFSKADIASVLGGTNGGTVTVTVTAPNPGLLLGDDTYLGAVSLDNVDQTAGLQVAAQQTASWSAAAGDYTISSGAFAVGTETTDPGDAVLVNGFSFAGTEQGSFGFLTPGSFLNIEAMVNTNPLSVFGLLSFDSEPSGVSGNVFFDNGAYAGGVDIQSALGAATPTYVGEMSVVTAQVASNILTADACADAAFIDLELEKSATSLTSFAGDTITFTIAVTNNGGIAATGVQVTDLLPAGFTLTNVTGSTGTYDSGTGLWDIGALAVGATETLDLEATVNAGGATTDYLNLAEVTAANEPDVDSTPNNGVDTNSNSVFADDPGDEDDGDGVQITVEGITITKTASAIAMDGSTDGKVRYLFTVTNNSAATTLSYDLIDTIDFDPDLTTPVTGELRLQPNPAIVATPTLNNGVATTLIANQSLAAGATAVWELLIDLGPIPLTLNGGTTNLVDLVGCNPGAPVAGTGLYNSADLAPANGGPAASLGLDAAACPTGENAGLLVTKQASAVVSELPGGGLRAVYDVIVYNAGLATTYDLTDTFGFDPDFTVVNTTMLINANSLATADLTGFSVTGASIATNSAHQFRIQVDVTHTGDTATALADVGACDAADPTMGVGMTNEASLVGPSGVPIEAYACPTGDGLGGTISFNKEAVSLSSVDADTVEVVYDLTVTNTTASTETYDLSDTFGFDSDFTVDSVSISATGGAVPLGSFDGSASPTIVSGQTIAGGATHVYTIRVVASYSGPNLDAAIAGCDPANPQTATGLFNMGVLTVNGIPVSDEACPGGVDLRFTKSASFVGYEGNSRFKVAYQITVENLRPAAATYDLVDTPNFDPNLAVTSATLSYNGGPAAPVAALTNGSPTTLASGVSLAAGAVDTYYLEVVIDASALATASEQFSALLACSAADPVSGTGAYNSAYFVVDGQTFAPVEACPDGSDAPVLALKQASAVVDLGGGALRIIYYVAVANPGSTTVAYDLADVLNFNAGYTVTSVTLAQNDGGATSDLTGFTGTSVALPSGAQHNYLVEVEVQHSSNDAATATATAGQCDPSDPVPGTGLYNSATVTGPNGVPVVVEACPPGDGPSGTLIFDKQALSAVQVSATQVDVVYQLTVQNTSASSLTYDLNDQFAFNTTAFPAISSLTVTASPGASGSPSFDGVGNTALAVGEVIAPGETDTFTLSLSVFYSGADLSADVNACDPNNPTAGDGLFNSGVIFVDGIPVNDDACPNLSALSLTKVANPASLAQLGDTISYTFAIENNGTSAVDTLVLSDPQVSNLVCAASSTGGTAFSWTFTGSQASSTAGSLPVGDEIICTAVYTVSAGDVSAGSITNTATVTGQDAGGASLSDTASATVTTEASDVVNEINVTKIVTGYVDNATPAGSVDVGDTVNYQITVQNTGKGTLSNVTVSDSLIASLSCSPAQGSSLAVGASMVCTGSHTVTAGDLAAATAGTGVLENVATGTGEVLGGGTISDSDTASVTLEPAGITPAIDLIKTLDSFTDNDSSGGYSVGDDLVYRLTFTNTGSDSLSGVTINDTLLPGASVACSAVTPAVMAPLDSVTCTVPYTIVAGDIVTDAVTGEDVVINTATVQGTSVSDPTLSVTDTEQLILVVSNTPLLAAKVASILVDEGNGNLKVNYAVAVLNPSVGPLDYDIADVFNFGAGFTVTGTTLLQNDGGGTESLTGFTVSGATLNSGIIHNYLLEVEVSHASGDSATAIADVGLCDPASPTPGTGLYNAATITTSTGAPLVVEACPSNGLIFSKTAPSAVESSPNEVDVVYQLTVQNNSADAATYDLVDGVNLGAGFGVFASPLSVTATPASVTPDPTWNGVSNLTIVSGQAIAAGETHVFTINMRMAYSGGGDLETAVNACDPNDPTPGTGLYNSARITIDGLPVFADACPNLSTLNLSKLANPPSGVTEGDTISYTFLIENNGNSAVDTLVLDDPLVSNLFCAATSNVNSTPFTWSYAGSQASSTSGALAVGDSIGCTAVYTVTAGDVTAGSVTNTATVTGVDGGGATVTGTASAVVPTEPQNVPGEISVTKSVVGFNDTVTANGRIDAGESVDYSITAINTGTTDLTNVQVTDTLIASLSCSPALGSTLAPGASMTCTGSYTVTAGDFTVASGSGGVLTNTATATGQQPGGGTVSDTDTASITLDPAVITPVIDLSKVLNSFTDNDGNGAPSVGDELVYGFIITNVGADTLTGVTLIDSLVSGSLSCAPVLPTSLAVGDSAFCTASYTIAAVDIVAGAGGVELLINTATATGTGNLSGLAVSDVEQLIIEIFPNMLDYGDLPDSYDGLPGSGDDASHSLDAGLYMGTTAPDIEAGKQAPLDTTGDDVTGVDDEDAIAPSVPLSLASTSYTLTVPVTTPDAGACSDATAFTLVGWIDFDDNGVFDASERSGLFGLGATTSGNAALSWSNLQALTLNAPASGSYAVRLRLYEGTQADPQPIGFGGCGEVEDGLIVSSDPDFGDAASGYEGGNPASHTPGGIQLGAVGPDGEAAPQPDGSLTGDDNAGVDDEDGINTATFLPYGVGADTYDLDVITAQVPTEGGVVAGCADFNDNGSFDAAEITYSALASGDTAATLSWSGLNALPSTTPASGNYTLRLRVFERSAVETVPGTIDPALVVCDGPGGVGEVEDHALLAVLPQVIIARKSADVSTVTVGDFIQWTMEYENTLAGPLNNVTLRDWLPAGVAYVAGSARVQRIGIDAAPVADEPSISGGSVLSWPGYDFQAAGGAGDTIVITILTTVGTVAQGATLENRTQALTAGDMALSNVGRAFVTVEASGVFDCSDIIGQVFEDLNGNGYQDPGEGGIAGVNIYTARGQKITVDRHGRYHVPCGATPDDRGQNFILKLHEQTLPLGCQLTTENPRVVRVTPGKFTKANFGASCGKSVSVFLCDDVFVQGSTQVLDTWRPQVGQLLEMMQSAPVTLNITHASGEGQALAERRLARLSRYLTSNTAGERFQSRVTTGYTNDLSRCPQKAPEPVPLEVCEVPTRYAIKSMISYCQGLRDLVVEEYYSYQPYGTQVANYNTYVRGVETWKADYKTVIANQNTWSRAQIQDSYLQLTQRYHQLMTYRNTYVVASQR